MATTGTHFTKAPLNIKSDFASIAREYGVYETAIGDHELVVKQYTQPPQDSPIKVLELGMGCRRTPAIRNLYRACQEYLPQTSELYAIESNSVCTDLVAGPQDHFDPEVFDNLVYIWEAMAPTRVPPRDGSYYGVEADRLGEEFEIIIDSGFHALEYQIQVLKAF
ncbi:hypothetical protein FPOAC2_01588 [Fusarium poae]|uniref:Uncharacterized protein n=1 Tax=Fusarium poae TaxID=36050 RepID=A0A1B8B452_FUSPO|nr:hypothetical protein FPOAC1_001507 [Fusarium poae]KAG8675526.1 hypothetical protein FPOAC1_001507 [Fusarium poae]OBS27503.1 hypothetical protein FPOA_01445 [Fusarium poae]